MLLYQLKAANCFFCMCLNPGNINGKRLPETTTARQTMVCIQLLLPLFIRLYAAAGWLSVCHVYLVSHCISGMLPLLLSLHASWL